MLPVRQKKTMYCLKKQYWVQIYRLRFYLALIATHHNDTVPSMLYSRKST